MQKSVIDFIISTNCGLHEIIEQNEEYHKLSDESYDAYLKLMATLNKDEKEFLSKIIDAEMGMECESNETYFREGMKFGMRLAIECLCC